MKPKYVLISSVRDEEKWIDKSIQTVIAQTILPEKWIIVNDNSKDRTDKIVKKYLNEFPFIELIQVQNGAERNFISKVNALNIGIKQLEKTAYNFIGILDIDLSFDKDYYELITDKFIANKKLGLVGGLLYEKVNGEFKGLNVSLNYVAGGVQLFRREVFEKIGNFIPLKYGCEDTVTEVKTRMFGWGMKTFPEIKVFHHREMGSYGKNILANLFYAGKRDYLVGYHPLFYVIKVLSRYKDRPIFLSSIIRLLSYFTTPLLGDKRNLPNDFFQYFRYEQVLRLKGMLGLPNGKKFVPSSSEKLKV